MDELDSVCGNLFRSSGGLRMLYPFLGENLVSGATDTPGISRSSVSGLASSVRQLVLKLRSFISFSLQRGSVALVEILILLPAIVLTANSRLAYSRQAFWLLTAQFGWVGYAACLNLRI
jgi:hypothetical protein